MDPQSECGATNSEAFKTVARLRQADPAGNWIVFHTRYFAQLIKATGAPIFNGTKIVPDLPFLHLLDRGTANEFTYNRYANIVCQLPRGGRRELVEGGLVHPDLFVLFLPPDLPVLQAAGYRYVVFPSRWADPEAYGFSLREKITPGNLWIYRRNAPAAAGSGREARFPGRLARF